MLFERWSEVSRASRNQIALRELSSSRCWSFGELAAEAEKGQEGEDRFYFPHGNSGEFVFAVLRAWRFGGIVCPLEPEQSAPRIAGKLPAGIVHLKTTSASTGTPRLVAFTASQLMADAQNIVSTMGLRPDWPNLGVISLAHSYGFSNLILPLLLHGVPLILAGSSLPEAIRQGAGLETDLTLASVPALWRAWHEADAIPRKIRLAISAGAPLPLQLEEEVFKNRGLKIHNFYGSSECGGIAYDGAETPRSDSACAGARMSNVRATVAPDGCLEVRSAAVGERYWPEASASLGDGVFRTSDLAEVANGLIYLRGRAGDQINVAGRKVAPETIEKVLRGYPDVRECLAFGVPSSDAERGEMIVMCLSTSANVTRDVLKEFLREQLPAWQVPREWWFLDDLETNHRGKFSRAEWRKRYLERKG